MSWEDKFSSIVKETESNLARVRDRLGSSRMRSSTGRVNFTSPTRDSSNFQSSGLSASMDNLSKTTMFSSPYKSSLSPSKSLNELGRNHHRISNPTKAIGSSQPGMGSNGSPALLNLIYDRMEQQSEMLESLSKTVQMLEKERNVQAEMISSLQSQVVKLNERLREQGVDLQTERKLEQFKREMYSHLQTIQNQYRLNDKGSSLHGDPSTASLARDIQDNKRLAQDDCESLRREIDHVKTRISKLEMDTNSTIADARDSARRLDRIDRTVTVLSENQRSQSHSLESMVDDRDMRSFELGSMRQKINDLSRQVSEWESDSQGQRLLHRNHRPLSGSSSNSSKSKTQLPKHPKTKGTLLNGHASTTTAKKSKRKPLAKDLDVSLSDSDLDMSSALLAIDSDTDTDLTSIQMNTNSLRVDTNPEISDLSSSLSSLNSDELLGL